MEGGGAPSLAGVVAEDPHRDPVAATETQQ